MTDNATRVANNPAGRIVPVLRAMTNAEPSRARAKVWSEVFGWPDMPTPDMLTGIAAFIGEVAAARQRVEGLSLSGHRVELNLRDYHQVEAVAARAHLIEGAVDGLRDGLTEVAIYGVEHCDQLLSQFDPDMLTADVTSLEDLMQRCMDLIRDVGEATELTQRQRLVVVDHLLQVYHVMREARISGAEPIRRELDGLAGAVLSQSDLRDVVEQSPIGRRIVAFVVGVSMVLTMAADVKALTASDPTPSTVLMQQTNINENDVTIIIGELAPPKAIESGPDTDEAPLK